MLGAKFTHVGIGVGRSSRRRGRSAGHAGVRAPAAATVRAGHPGGGDNFVSSLRRAKGAAARDRRRPGAATGRRGRHRLPDGRDAATPDQAIAAAQTALVGESKRLHLSRGPVCLEFVQVLELDELEQDPILIQQRLDEDRPRHGDETDRDRRSKLFVLVLAEGATCH